MMIEFKIIEDIDSFTRIWNSNHEDGYPDSDPFCLADTPKERWMPVFERWKSKKTMKEILMNSVPVGHIHLSPKTDASAHLGYGLYKKFRGKGLIHQICTQFLNEMIPGLGKEITHLLATTLPDNIISQKTLIKLGFKIYQKHKETHNNIEIEYIQFRKDLS